MVLVDAALSAFLQAALLGGVPFLGYAIYHKRRHKRTFGAIARRAGACLRLDSDQVRFDHRVVADARLRQCDDGADGGEPNIRVSARSACTTQNSVTRFLEN